MTDRVAGKALGHRSQDHCTILGICQVRPTRHDLSHALQADLAQTMRDGVAVEQRVQRPPQLILARQRQQELIDDNLVVADVPVG